MAPYTPTLDRTRPAGRPTFEAESRPPHRKPAFETLLDELLHARSRYEHLRINGESIAERADLLQHLHALRASIAGERVELT